MIFDRDTDKHQCTHSALKIQEFTYKTISEKRNLLVKELKTAINELFIDSLDEV